MFTVWEGHGEGGGRGGGRGRGEIRTIWSQRQFTLVMECGHDLLTEAMIEEETDSGQHQISQVLCPSQCRLTN